MKWSSAMEGQKQPALSDAFNQWGDICFGMLKSSTLKAVVDLSIPDILAKAGPGRELTVFEIAQQLPSETVEVDYLYRILTYASLIGIFTVASTPSGSNSSDTAHANGDKATDTNGEAEVAHVAGNGRKASDTNGEANGGHGDGGPAARLSALRTKDLKQRRFGATVLSMLLTEECNPRPETSLAHMTRFLTSKPAVLPSLEFAEAVLTSQHAFQIAHKGLNEWDASKGMSEFGPILNKAMASFSATQIDSVLQGYKGFEGIKVLVDVGGGLGASLAAITEAYPGIRGINFDLPFVVAKAPKIPGVEHLGGDMFQSVPEGGDAIFMKWILHDWTDEQCIQILQNCRKALPSDGKVILVEHVLPLVNDVKTGDGQYHSDMLMMIHTQGRERSKTDWVRILEEASFSRVEVILTPGIGVIEAYKS